MYHNCNAQICKNSDFANLFFKFNSSSAQYTPKEKFAYEKLCD
jgi:hypothetical protein